MRRLSLWLLAAVLVLAAGGGAAWWWLRGAGGKAELEAILGEALGRDVRIGVLEVDPRGRVTLRDVDVGNPTGFEGAPMLHADAIDLDVAMSRLLDRELDGVVTASAVELRVVKQDGAINLAGLVRPRRADAGEPIDLHLDVAILAARVLLEDHDRQQSLTLEGVDVRALLSNRDGDRRAEAAVRIAEVGLHGLPVREVAMTVRADGTDVAVDGLTARIGERGTFSGSGRLFLAGARDWTVEGVLEDVDLDADVRRVVAVVYPPLSSSVDATAATGRLGATLSLGGAGLHWEEIRPTLAGEGTLRLYDVVLPKGSLLLGLAALVGRPDAPWSLARADVVFSLAEEWVTLDRVTADGASASLPITGRVSLGGALDLTADLMPLLPVFGGGAYREVARYATSLPVRIRGTVEHPEVAPPSAADVGKSLLGGALRRALGPAQ
ncbi:MAG: hypothetical protein JNK45_23100 [Myxococcales bacterium]|jgi:hypothetical protein|nr:hypothetical protein [Myxococcales bacterium]